MTPLTLVRYAVSDLRHRPAATLLNVAAVALSAAYCLVLGYYAAAIYRYQQGVLADNLPTRVVATTPEVTDPARRFTDERLAELSRLPGVALAFPEVELNVKASLGDGPAADVPAEGTVPADPGLAPSRLAWGAGIRSEDGREAVLGRALFERLGGTLGADGPQPARLTLQVGRTARGREEVLRVPLRIVGLLRHESSDRVHVPLRLARLLDLYCTHRLEAVPAAGGRIPAARIDYPYCLAYVPPEQAGRVAAEARNLAALARPAGELETLDEAGPIATTVERTGGEPLRPVDEAAARRLLAGRAALEPGVPPRVSLSAALVGEPLAAVAAWPALEDPGLSARFDEPLAYLAAARAAARRGLCLRPRAPLPARRLLRFEVRDGRRPGGAVGDDLVTVLSLTEPTFVAARPFLAVRGRTGAGSLELVASGPLDPERFADPPLAGGWLAPGDDRQVVLPREAAAALAEGGRPADLVGRAAAVRFRRETASGPEEVELPLRVVGVTAAERGRVPLRLAADVALWRQGKLVFSEGRRAFESPVEVTLRGGAVRCCLYARDAAAVGGLVRELEARGYRTDNRLGEQEGLRRLGQVLAFLVGAFVLGSVVNAAISVLLSTMMTIRSKTWEIGILRAHGVGSGRVLAVFGLQGVVVGAGAFLAAAGLVWLLEPLLRGQLADVFAGRAAEALRGSPFEWSLWWLPATALGLSLGFSLLGVLIPAALACRLAPVEALRRRE